MNRAHRRLDDDLGHILEAIERIDRYTEGLDERAFRNNRLVRDAVIRNFEIIGEASNNIEKHYPLTLRQHIPTYPSRLPTRCATLLRTATSRWTTKSFGGRSTVTWRSCLARCPTWRISA
jgi:hypothetical protein